MHSQGGEREHREEQEGGLVLAPDGQAKKEGR